MKTCKAKIRWLTNRIPPIVPPEKRKKQTAYSPIILFSEQPSCLSVESLNREEVVWSSIIFNEEINGQYTISSVSFGVPEAPIELMRPGAKFALFEGPRKVAEGEIID